MRQGELLGLAWERVEMWVEGVIRSSRKPSQASVARSRCARMLYEILSGLGQSHGLVWPMEFPRKAFESAVEAAKLDAPLTFHDLRHTFASRWMMRRGSLLGLSKVLGHATLQMTQRYAHLSPDHVRGEMERTSGAVLEPVAGAKRGGRGHRAVEVLETLMEPGAGVEPATY